MSGYIGNVPVPQATQTRDSITATSGQTSFPTSGYTPGYLDVYLNGVHLESSDYTASNGSDVVLAVGATAGDILTVVAYTTFEVSQLNVSIEDLNDVNTMAPSDGQLLTWDNANSRWDAADAPVSLPTQTGHSGEFLTTDGSTASWATVPSDYNVTSMGLYENANTISANYSITSGNNAMSAGPITVNSGISVTVPSGSTWTII